MSDLSPELQRLVIAGKLASQPSSGDRERVFAALDARLGVAAGIAGGALGATVARSSARALTAKTVGLATATLAIMIGGFVFVHSRATARAREVIATGSESIAKPSHLAIAAPEPPPLQAPILAVPENSATPREPNSAPSATRGSVRPHDSLSAEVAILSRAQTELHGGRAENALRLLAEHERKFKRGILAEERTSTKIQALCALGRVSEANALLGRLTPQSLSDESARQACSSNKQSTPRR